MAESYSDVYGVLLAGGSGTRLWPVSRSLYPKQLVKFFGPDSLVQHTVKRLMPVIPEEKIRVVCGQDHARDVSRHLSEIGLSPAGKIVPEPCGRNTAPAILLAVLHALGQEPDPVLCIFPADHAIRPKEAFLQTLSQAVDYAREGHIVTFGIQPRFPETGYGYIEGGEEIQGNARKIKRFVEKPDRETAIAYIESGRFFWNSGMFVFKASQMIEEFRTHQPLLYDGMAAALKAANPPTREAYEKLPSISVDYAIMEKTDRGALLPSAFEWSDIGSWKALYDYLPKDENGNACDGDVMTNNVTNSLLMGIGGLISANHVDRMAIVGTPDAVFVSDMEKSREVQHIVARLKEAGRIETVSHRDRREDWGTIAELCLGEGFRVAQYTVLPKRKAEITAGEGDTIHLVIAEGRAAVRGKDGVSARNAGSSLKIGSQESVALNNQDENPLIAIVTFVSGKGDEA